MSMRQLYEQTECGLLSPYAVRACESRGRKKEIPDCDIRTCFQRDVDRVTHSKAFRRLMKKTQVFLRPEGDHYRTRLTHTLEVSRIARTMARALRLNEDLAEAMALGHDLGHTPFGHAGEAALNEIVPGGFQHNEQSVRVVERIEREGEGLNLTREVLDGIQCHSGPLVAASLEGRLLKFADRIAYINHDIDDAVRAGILKNTDIPRHLSELLGEEYNLRIDTMVRDVILHSKNGEVAMSPEIGGAMLALREFMFERVYKNQLAKGEESKARDMIHRLYEYYISDPSALPADYLRLAEEDGTERAVSDYIAGMTDPYAVSRFEELFIPRGWSFVEAERYKTD